MTTKLIDMNVGIQLTLLVDGKQKMVTWSAVCPSEAGAQPADILEKMTQEINKIFGTCLFIDGDEWKVPIAKTRKIKAHRAVSQEEFNRRIKELQP